MGADSRNAQGVWVRFERMGRGLVRSSLFIKQWDGARLRTWLPLRVPAIALALPGWYLHRPPLTNWTAVLATREADNQPPQCGPKPPAMAVYLGSRVSCLHWHNFQIIT
jgi:hypothetical protein